MENIEIGIFLRSYYLENHPTCMNEPYQIMSKTRLIKLDSDSSSISASRKFIKSFCYKCRYIHSRSLLETILYFIYRNVSFSLLL